MGLERAINKRGGLGGRSISGQKDLADIGSTETQSSKENAEGGRFFCAFCLQFESYMSTQKSRAKTIGANQCRDARQRLRDKANIVPPPRPRPGNNPEPSQARLPVVTIRQTRTLAHRPVFLTGDALVEMLTRDGHKLTARRIVRDEIPAIVGQLAQWTADPKIDVVISTGSTGVTGRDGWEEILKHQLDTRFRPRNLVELMPRLQEHLRRSHQPQSSWSARADHDG